MYSFFLILHNGLRWFVLLMALVAIGYYAWSYLRGRAYDRTGNLLGATYVGSLHLQLIIGLVLYIFLSPATSLPFPEGWIKIKALRFKVLEHPLMMLLAITAAQVGRSLSRRQGLKDRTRYLRSLLGFALSLVLLSLGVPKLL